MRICFAIALFTVFAMGQVAWAAPNNALTPTSANQVSGPVQGRLNDEIEVSVDPYIASNPGLTGRDSLNVSFCTETTVYDTVLTNGVKVKNPRVICTTPSRKLHLSGKRQMTGVTMTPAIQGTWRWSDDYRLQFKPRMPWPMGTGYLVKFDSTVFPGNVLVKGAVYNFKTDVLTPTISDMKFFQDPTHVEQRGVSAAISFNGVMEIEKLKQFLTVGVEELSVDHKPSDRKIIESIENLPFDLQMSENNKQAVISIPLKIMPDQERFLKLSVKPGLVSKFGGVAMVIDSNSPTRFSERVQIPSRFGYAKIENIEARIVKNDSYVPEQILIIQTNVPVATAELSKSLELYLLPKDKESKISGYSSKKDYAWVSTAEITDDILKSALSVSVTALPDGDAPVTMHSFKIDSDSGRWIYAKIGGGFTGAGNYVFKDDFKTTFIAPEYGQEVKLLSDGALLSLSGEKKVSVYSLGVPKIKFKIKRVRAADIQHLITQTRGNFENPEFNDGSFNDQNLTEVYEKELALSKQDARKPQFSSFDFSPYLLKKPDKKNGAPGDKGAREKGLFFLEIQGVKPDKDGNNQTVSTDRRFVLISDLGLIVKTNRDGTRAVFVQSVAAGQAVFGARVQVLGVNGLPVFNGITNETGRVNVPDLSAFTNEKTPVVYTAQIGSDLSFMPYARYDRALDMSKFETDGLTANDKGLRAFLFSDRGIYRPGETAQIGGLVKQGDWAVDMDGLPLQLEITNPRGQVVDKPIVTLNKVGMMEYSFSTTDTSATGEYNVRLYITKDGNAETQLGSTSVRVEEFLPDTMKITSDFNKPIPKGWIKPDGIKATVTLAHLYGAPAVDHRVRANINVAPASFSFKDFDDYTFFDASKPNKNFDQPIGVEQTDAKGQAIFDLNLSQFGDSTYRMTFYGEGFAQGSGRSVKTAKSVLVSSRPYVIGVKNSARDYINKLTKQNIEFIALDPDLKQIPVPELKIQTMAIAYVSTLMKDENGAYVYRSVATEKIAHTENLNITTDGAIQKLDTATPGVYALVVMDSAGVALARVPYTIIGEGNMLGAVRKDATMTVKLNKPEYAPGGKIEMNIVSPYIGAGLITIETDRVLTHKWFTTTTTSSVQTIDIPAELTGRAFISIEFLRARSSREIYAKPLAYTALPFMVSTDHINSHIELITPEKVKPGDTLKISYTTEKPSKIIIYGVDEGILQYGHYATPKPIDYFVGKRGLQVRTDQILDLLMPEYSIMKSLSAPGGDMAGMDGKNLNPFRRKTLPPTVFWSGIIDADETEHEYTYKVPEYFNGGIRVMAVSVSGDRMGAAEVHVGVKGDLIVTPNVPTFAAPGDEFVVGVAIANNIIGSGDKTSVKMTAKPSSHLEILSGGDTSFIVPEGHEGKTDIRVRVRDVLGSADLMFTAASGKKMVTYTATLSVRPPVPSMTALLSGYTDKGTVTIKLTRDIYPEFGSSTGAVSVLPISLVPGLAAYLHKFPYGCTEQTISQAMPAVILAGNSDLGDSPKITEESVIRTLNTLRERQNDNGGFGYWGSGGVKNDFISAYALHYMTLAIEKHLPVPDDIFRNTLDDVKKLVNRAPHSLDDARVQAYGIYLLTRNGEVTANYIPNVLKYLDAEQKNVWKTDLAAVYIAASYKLMQLVPEADKLMDEFTLGDPAYWTNHSKYWESDDSFYNSLNRYAQYLTIISDHFPDRLNTLDRNVLFRIANFIGEGSYNTLSSSYAILAFAQYGAAATNANVSQLTIAQKDASGSEKQISTTGVQIKKGTLQLSPYDVSFGGGGPSGLFYQLATDGYDRAHPTAPIEDGLEISRVYETDDHKPVSDVKIGDTVNVVITMRGHDDQDRRNMAMVDLFPSGFDIVPESVANRVRLYGQDSSDEEGDEPNDETEYESDGSDESELSWTPDMVNAREDRVIAFGTISPDAVTWRYKIKAVNTGTFITPPAYIESMYDRSIKARGIVGKIIVK